jgi:hypothetical protein
VNEPDEDPPPYLTPDEPPLGTIVRTSDLSKPRWQRDEYSWVLLDRPGCIQLGATWDYLCQRYGPVTIEHPPPSKL